MAAAVSKDQILAVECEKTAGFRKWEQRKSKSTYSNLIEPVVTF